VSEASPHPDLSRLISGYWVSQAIYVAAKLGLADLVRHSPRTVDELAGETSTHAPALYRLLRALASVGVFAETHDGRFAQTPLSAGLQSGVLGSKRALAIMMGEEHYRAWGGLLGSVQTGKPAFEMLYGMPVFDFLAGHPEQAAIFDEAMTGIHGSESAAVLDAYDFSGIERLVDIGGGNGSQLAAILERYPQLQGTLYDLPGVVERANPRIQAAGLTQRMHLVAGDFFHSVPPGADAYLLRHIIHDWDDAQAIRILRSIHEAIAEEGRVLIVESIVPAGNDPSFVKLLDLTMLVIPGGQERTQSEYELLLGRAGFRLVHVTTTDQEISIIEARKA
jgi:hypothetical protein